MDGGLHWYLDSWRGVILTLCVAEKILGTRNFTRKLYRGYAGKNERKHGRKVHQKTYATKIMNLLGQQSFEKDYKTVLNYRKERVSKLKKRVFETYGNFIFVVTKKN